MNWRELLDLELSRPENEPLHWLLREALLQGEANYLSDMTLARRANLTLWNRMIDRYRSVLVNPDAAVKKVSKEVNLAVGAREERDGTLNDLYAELLAVVTLAERGYQRFEAVVEQTKSPDFMAENGTASVMIEVKNLREPDDRIHVAAARWWARLRDKEPHRYNFPIQVYHDHQGPITLAALKRLRTLLSQLPDRAGDRLQETLDGGIELRIQKGNAEWIPKPEFECSVGGQRTVTEPPTHAQVIIRSPLRIRDFEFNSEDFQRFFLKVLRKVSEATTQLFPPEASTTTAERIAALRWEAPHGMYFESYLTEPKSLIEGIFREISALGNR
jgi:hypothetical protein